MLYTGIDLHRSFSYITTMDNDGKIVGQKKLPSDGEIVEFLKEFGETMEVAIEATPSWYWLYDQLKDEGFKVKLSHPLKTKAIAYAKVKTDKVDSATLAHLLRSNLLPLSYVPEKPVRLNRELLRYRASLVKIQTSVKNKIHTILAKNNIGQEYSDLFGKEGMTFLHSLALPENYKIALEGYIAVLDAVRQEIREASRKVQQLAEEDRDALLLMTIPGMGYYSALLTRSEIGDVKRFRQYAFPRAHNQTGLQVATVDSDRGSYTCSEKAWGITPFLLQGREEKGRSDCQSSDSEEAPGVDLPYTQRWQDLPGDGKDSRHAE